MIDHSLMATRAPHNDKPITEPADDRFGIDPFAKTLASSIRKLMSPEGTVIALNGPFGSGKSSAVNLVLYHLKEAIAANEIAVINFTCWWFRGEEALALAFFRELYAGLGPTLGERFTRALPKLGARLLRAGSMVGSSIDLAGGAGAGAVAAGAMSWLSSLIQADDTVEKLHAELTEALNEQKKRFLIVIDDVDRLAPDEALLIFRLVKSIGRLPNVIYLLAFDRQLAELVVSEKYPSEGPHYLEKIIQAGFDVPQPRHADLCQELLQEIGVICGSPEADDIVRFMNVFYDVVAPEIKTPRDLIRLTNALLVTWAAVGSEVDRADFIGLETLRLLRPGLYRALRGNKDHLCGTSRSSGSRSPRDGSREYDRMLFGSTEEQDRERLRRGLMRLFPRLEAVWSNMHYGESSAAGWAAQRRVCANAHFDSYFRFSLGDETLPRQEIDELVARAADQEFVKTALRESLSTVRAGGSTKAALLLDELNLHADKISDDNVQPLLRTIFEVADELDVPSDEARGFNFANNRLRIHWLLRRLTRQRFDLARRSAVLMGACEMASLGWLVDLADSAYGDHHPREGKQAEPEQNCLTTTADASCLRAKALTRIRNAAKSGELAGHRQLGYLLYRWREFVEDDGEEVKQWTLEQLDHDDKVVNFAKAFTSHSWSQGLGIGGLGDMVAKRNTRANVESLNAVMDEERFRARVEELAATNTLVASDTEAIREFLEAWRQHDTNPLLGVLFDAHFDSSATMLADSPEVENFTTKDGCLIID
jgi:predicted KAP-like P-loop ATPase